MKVDYRGAVQLDSTHFLQAFPLKRHTVVTCIDTLNKSHAGTQAEINVYSTNCFVNFRVHLRNFAKQNSQPKLRSP